MRSGQRVLPLSTGAQKLCISPPGMCSSELMKARSVWNTDEMKYPAEFKYDTDQLFRYPVRHHERQMVMFKKLANMVVGSQILSSSPRSLSVTHSSIR